MKYYNTREINFSNDKLNTAFVVRSNSGYESTEEIIVKKVRLTSDDSLDDQTGEYNKENGWFSLIIYGDVLWFTISSLYDAIYYKLVNNDT